MHATVRSALAGCLIAVIAANAGAASDRVSKLEAHQLRRSCGLRANERGLKDKERDIYLDHCYASRTSHIAEIRACHIERERKGVDEQRRREFMRACVQEKLSHK